MGTDIFPAFKFLNFEKTFFLWISEREGGHLNSILGKDRQQEEVWPVLEAGLVALVL